jgi:hypothetical protein
MDEEQCDYASYLLRLWKAQRDGQTIWRASLECTQDEQRQNFASLETLIAFLQEQFGTGGASKEEDK